MNTTALSTMNNTIGMNLPAVSDRRTAKLTARAANEMVQQTHLAVTHEQGRALLAYTALEHVALLSEMERTCYKLAPFGEGRYGKIVDAFTAGAAMQIARW